MTKISEFLRTLPARPCANAQKAAEVCDPLIRWLACLDYFRNDVKPIDVILLPQVASVLHQNIETFGNDKCTGLTQELHHKWEVHDKHLKKFYQAVVRINPIVYVAEKVLQLKHCEQHLPAIKQFFLTFLSLQQLEVVVEKIYFHQRNDVHGANTFRQEAEALLIKLFRLSNNDIPEAMNRLVDLHDPGLKFVHIAHLILVPSDSIIYKKSLLVKKSLFARLNEGLISHRFFDSIAEECSADEDTSWLLFSCLRNAKFASSIIQFLLAFLSTCKYHEPRKSFFSEKFKQFNFKYILQIIGALLCHQSPVRIALSKKLFSSDCVFDLRLNKIIQMQTFLFDY